MHIIHGSRAREDRGAAAVEFALVVLPLLMVISGIVNFGTVYAQQLALDNSVRAGARAGAVDRGATAPTPVMVTTNQWDSTAFAKSQTTAINVTYPTIATCKGSTFGQSLAVRGRVTATFLFPWPVPNSLIPNSVTLSSQAEFQCEYQ